MRNPSQSLAALACLLFTTSSLALSIKLTASHDAYFEPAGETLDSEQRTNVEKLINHRAFQPCRLVVAIIVGHADVAEASTVSLDELSTRRARYVKELLVRHGVAQDLIYVEGKGARQPLGQAGAHVNRRVDIEAVAVSRDNCEGSQWEFADQFVSDSSVTSTRPTPL